ncbi:branched-chain amino acid ABC transporter permease [Pusillimonas noertemannii]|uniref:Amino acid/amide ABC transporter membrane protein 1 (HAAT family) n=1 Tax=Pusillimonas noertemannii TaxID=305977 RepID=A0A2U1CQ73_9BURK|nr:branched-chain amino acid ABC transporter permease [Pusillimonas noertemannii]NYT67360.1 branched-chain amino acid ABC transporter permease [Pusillimonas noertemannii]PVY68033.1 amino acid/amide ABC transporter membrane protein 1 (HAAT family) [Pusillimonas noertemannii]TFL12455.1 branched-chain amino acid ABC transporter permease [Pusillimonas noertemannii]
MAFYAIQFLNGLSLAMLLFLISSGLSVIFGMMRIVNLAHGSFYLLGGYIGLTVLSWLGNFWLAILAAAIVVGLFGIVLQRTLLRRVSDNELGQVLMTFGILLIVADLALWVWGGLPQTLSKPSWLNGSFRYAGLVFPKYRVAMILLGLVVAVLIWLVIERTRIGAIIRAGVDDSEMVRGIGIDIRKAFLLVFGAGAALAGVAGVLGGAMLGVYPGVDFDVLLQAFAVVVVGGLGSLRGAFVGSLLIGFSDTLGKVWFTDFALFTIFVPMVIMLVIRPEGLFGRE